MEVVRIKNKVISRQKIDRTITEILHLRTSGLSQKEVAQRLGVDRTLVCRLESLGEIRKGRRLAVIGFPVQNKEELKSVLVKEGVEFIFLMTEKERWDFIEKKSGIELVNKIMELIALVHSFDHIVVIGSGKRVKIIEAVLGKEVVGYEIGQSPIQEDKYVDPDEIVKLIRAIKA